MNHYTLLLYQIETWNGASLILPFSLFRDYLALKTKRIFEFLWGILEWQFLTPAWNLKIFWPKVELVSKELNHFGVIAGLFWQIGGHSSRFVLFCSFWRLFSMKMIKSVKVFPFSFWKIITFFFFYFIKFKPPA